MNRDPRVLALLEGLRDSTVSIYFVPDLFAFNLIQARFDLINGIPLVAVRESPFYGVRALAKRLTDVLVAGAATLLLAPVLLLVALGVRLTSPGPDRVPAEALRPRWQGHHGLQISLDDRHRGR